MSDDLKKLDDLDKGINKPQPKKDIESFLGWHDLKREDLPYGGRLFPKNYIFQVQAASADSRGVIFAKWECWIWWLRMT